MTAAPLSVYPLRTSSPLPSDSCRSEALLAAISMSTRLVVANVWLSSVSSELVMPIICVMS